MSKPRPSINFAISSATLRRAATIRASATVPAEIRTTGSVSSIAMQASASASPRTMAMSAEVSTAIMWSRQSLGQTVFAVQEVLASGGAGPRRGASAAGLPDRLTKFPAGLRIRHPCTWAPTLAGWRAYAAGLPRLGLTRGDRIAIIGGNRPRLYWSVMAAQMLGAIPVPVYADAVAEELAFVLAHADVRFAAVQDQEQVDKLSSVSERLPAIAHILYDEPRGLRDYDHARLHAIERVIHDGRTALAADAALGGKLDDEIAAGQGSDVSIILYTSGTTGVSKGVMLSAAGCIAAASDTVAFDRLDENDAALAYLPLAWVGDHYLNYAQGMVAGFCMACPETSDTALADIREIGPTFFFAPPRVFEQMLTRVTIRMEDAGRLKRALFRYFIGVARRYGEKLLDRRAVPVLDRKSTRLN